MTGIEEEVSKGKSRNGESVKKPELKSLNREGAKIAKRAGLFYAIGNDHLKARVTGKQMLCIGLHGKY